MLSFLVIVCISKFASCVKYAFISYVGEQTINNMSSYKQVI
jgi:hypothetical protein